MISLEPEARSLPIFCACCLWPCLGPSPAGWPNPKGKGQFWGFSSPVWQCTVMRSLQITLWSSRTDHSVAAGGGRGTAVHSLGQVIYDCLVFYVFCVLAGNTVCSIKWIDTTSPFLVSSSSAEALVRWGGTIKHFMIAYFLHNTSTQNYENRLMYVKFWQLVPLLTNRDISSIRRGRLYSSCVQSSMLHGNETWPVRKENKVALQQAEMRMVRWMCDVKVKDKVPSKELIDRIRTGLD